MLVQNWPISEAGLSLRSYRKLHLEGSQVKKTRLRQTLIMSPRYRHVVLVSGYLILTGARLTYHGCPISKYAVNPPLQNWPISEAGLSLRSYRKLHLEGSQVKKTRLRQTLIMSPRYSHVVLVSGYLILTGARLTYHGCPISKYVVNPPLQNWPISEAGLSLRSYRKLHLKGSLESRLNCKSAF